MDVCPDLVGMESLSHTVQKAPLCVLPVSKRAHEALKSVYTSHPVKSNTWQKKYLVYPSIEYFDIKVSRA